jgi:sigma-54 dependent transcriptional regulator of gfr operon
MLKDDILIYLAEKTALFVKGQENDEFTAVAISNIFNVKRNTVSHYLNQMVEDGEVIKVNTRPVYFFHRATFANKFFEVSNTVYPGFEQLYEEEPKAVEHNIFNSLIGSGESLKKAIEQIRTSILYPKNGLPLMLSGPTGVGKSFMAQLIHRFSVQEGVIKENAPFIMFNCAQYFNNPELLSSNLFGYVKGAFTGADQTRPGMLEAADGGILFLDEVHRLNKEGQEKLFTFMDQGVFRRMGEHEGWHSANVRLIFATTESLTETFLETFLRRVPVLVSIPGLDERGNEEKLQFIYNFLINEAKTFDKKISLSKRAVDAMLRYTYKGNVGELKNTIKCICAAAYSRDLGSEKIEVKLHDLPEKMLKESVELTEGKIIKKDEVVISPETTLSQLYQKEKTKLQLIKHTYKQIFTLYEEYKTKKTDRDFFEKDVFNEVYSLIDKLIFEKPKDNESVLMQFTTSSLQEVFRYVERNYSVKFNGNSVYTIASFLYAKNYDVITWDKETLKACQQLYNYMRTYNNQEYLLTNMIVNLISSKIDANLSKDDEIFISFYLKSLQIEKQRNSAKAVILAHGYATASSIANVVNRMLHVNMFEAFDMPIDISVSEIVSRLIEYIENNDVSRGLVILVDMGSLKDIYSRIKDRINGPVAIISNVSTHMALHVGEMLRKGVDLEELVSKLEENIETEYKIIYPQNIKPRAIITTCVTGIGTSLKLQKLLEASIPKELVMKIVVHDYERLKNNKETEVVFQLYNVLAMIGTTNPEIKQVNYISLEDLISGRGEDKLFKIFGDIADKNMIENINNNIVRNFSLESVVGSLTILDTNKILEHIEECLSNLEIFMNKKLPNDKKIALYVHVSCLVERLIRQEPIKDYPSIERFVQCQKNMINIIEKSFSVIESIYNVKINLAEIGYIYDILLAKTDSSSEF